MTQHNALRTASSVSASSAPAPSSRSLTGLDADAQATLAAAVAPSTASQRSAPPSSRSSLRTLLLFLSGPDGDAPIVRVLSPGDGEVLREGNEALIRWSSQDNIAVTAQRVQLSLDDGRSYEDISSPLAGTNTSFLWTVPGLSTQRGRIKVVALDAAGNRGFGSSARPFTICERPAARPAVRITAPTAQTLRVGCPVTICWQTAHVNPDAVRCDIYMSVNGQDYMPLALGLPGTVQRLRWSAPMTCLSQVRRARLRVVLRAGEQILAEDTSAEPLTISPMVTSPRPIAAPLRTERTHPAPRARAVPASRLG